MDEATFRGHILGNLKRAPCYKKALTEGQKDPEHKQPLPGLARFKKLTEKTL